MRFLKQIVLVTGYFSAIFLAFYAASHFDKLEDFQPYRCEEGGFSILLPGKAEEIAKEFDFFPFKGDITKITAGTRKSEFTVIYFKCPKANGLLAGQSPLEMMEMVTCLMTSGDLISEKDVDYHGHPAKDFELKILGRKTIKVRAIAVKNRCYQLIVSGNSKEVLEEKSQQFFESLKIDGVS